MKSEYERVSLIITEFDVEDMITTSGMLPTDPTEPPVVTKKREIENSYRSFNSLKGPGNWF